jgi:hypothetical protein
MDTSSTGTTARPQDAAPGLTDRAADVVQDLGTRVGGELLGADLGKELRESALLLGLALVVVGLVAALASTALLLG